MPLPDGVDMTARLPDGFDPVTAGGPDAMRIMCQKTESGPLTCTRNGEPLDAAEVERLRAMMPPIPDIPAGNRAVMSFSSRRQAE